MKLEEENPSLGGFKASQRAGIIIAAIRTPPCCVSQSRSLRMPVSCALAALSGYRLDRAEARKGSSTRALAAGTNALLRLGATPVTCPADVLEVFGMEPLKLTTASLGPSPRFSVDERRLTTHARSSPDSAPHGYTSDATDSSVTGPGRRDRDPSPGRDRSPLRTGSTRSSRRARCAERSRGGGGDARGRSAPAASCCEPAATSSRDLARSAAISIYPPGLRSICGNRHSPRGLRGKTSGSTGWQAVKKAPPSCIPGERFTALRVGMVCQPPGTPPKIIGPSGSLMPSSSFSSGRWRYRRIASRNAPPTRSVPPSEPVPRGARGRRGRRTRRWGHSLLGLHVLEH